MPFCNGEVLRSPALAVKGFDGPVIIGNVPVRAHNAFISIFSTQQVANYIGTVAVADVLSGRIYAVGNRVVGHYCRCESGSAFQFECSLRKGLQMMLKASSGVHRVFAVIEVGVTSAFFRTAGGPVLYHSIHAFRAPAAVRRTLESVNICACHISIQGRILAEGAVEAAPAGLCGKVYLRRQGRGNAQGAVLAGSYRPEFLNQPRVKSGGQSQGSGPEGNLTARAHIELRRSRSLIAGVR